jgi:hypothetical protein
LQLAEAHRVIRPFMIEIADDHHALEHDEGAPAARLGTAASAGRGAAHAPAER